MCTRHQEKKRAAASPRPPPDRWDFDGGRYETKTRLTTSRGVVIIYNMRAAPLINERLTLEEAAFVELVVWRLERPLPGCGHRFKYRLAYVVRGVCVVRYDNEAGKGDHRHVGKRELAYEFTSIEKLQSDFWADVARWKESP
jgi:hypothetical protein